jgi:hypothetical protein
MVVVAVDAIVVVPPKLIVKVPMDYVYWSPQLEGLVSAAGPRGELWITGRASQLATDTLASRGWKVVPQAGTRLVN